MLINDNIKKRRLTLGLTLEEIAKAVGTTRQTIQKYESGIITNIPSDKIERLAKALNTTPAYLMGWDEKESTNNSELDSQIEDLYNSLPEDKQKQAIEFLKFLQGK